MLEYRQRRRVPASMTWLLTAALVGCADAPTAPDHDRPTLQSAIAPLAPVQLTFDKSASANGVWQGTVAGDVDGTLQTVLTDLRVTGSIWHVRFDWIITAGEQSFTADLSGTLNLNTGRVVMNGRVVDGYLLGARVHEEGQLIDAASLRFTGTIRIMPGTAQ